MACALAATLPGCAAQEAATTYPVDGVVLNRLTHEPIARALVDATSDAALTDGDGRFELHLPEGFTGIMVRRPGYESSTQETAHALKVGPDMPALTFYLTPSAGIVGQVALSSGDEADHIRFTIYREQSVGGRAQWMPAGGAVTDSEGVFRDFPLRAPASYVLCSDYSPDQPGPAQFGYPSVCYPGGGDFASAAQAPLALSPGQQAQINIALTRQPFYRVSIAVANPTQAQGLAIPIFDASGRVLGVGAEWNRQRETAEAELPDGNYYAEARAWGKVQVYGRVDFSVADGPVSGLNLVLLPIQPVPVEIHKDFTAIGNGAGMVYLPNGQPADADPDMNLLLLPAASSPQGYVGGNLHRPDGSYDSDSYVLDGVIPGRYWVQANTYNAYISSITSGGIDLTREPLLIGPGGSTPPIEITLRNDLGRLACTVAGPSFTTQATGPASGEMNLAYVYAIPLFPSLTRLQQATAQLPGPVSMSLAPGSYLVVAFDSQQDLDMDDPNELARLTPQGQTVTVAAGGTTNVSVNLVHAAAQEAAQ